MGFGGFYVAGFDDCDVASDQLVVAVIWENGVLMKIMWAEVSQWEEEKESEWIRRCTLEGYWPYECEYVIL